jgi:acyl carrier protein
MLVHPRKRTGKELRAKSIRELERAADIALDVAQPTFGMLPALPVSIPIEPPGIGINGEGIRREHHANAGLITAMDQSSFDGVRLGGSYLPLALLERLNDRLLNRAEGKVAPEMGNKSWLDRGGLLVDRGAPRALAAGKEGQSEKNQQTMAKNHAENLPAAGYLAMSWFRAPGADGKVDAGAPCLTESRIFFQSLPRRKFFSPPLPPVATLRHLLSFMSSDLTKIRSKLQGYPTEVIAAFERFASEGDLPAFEEGFLGALGFLSESSSADLLRNAPDEARLREDLNIDSLALVELLFLLEDLFGAQIKDEEMLTVQTVADFKRLARGKMMAPQS